MEKRSFHRYHLTTPLTGLIEHEGTHLAGNILNMSTGGFLLHLPTLPANNPVPYGESDYGEIHYADRKVHGFGQIVRVETLAKGVGIGFSWDINEIDKTGTLLIAEIIQQQVEKRQAGYVTTAESVIVLGGHVSSALASDTFACLKKIGAANARLSMQACLSIDSSGIEMLLTLRDMAVPITDVGDGIKSVMERFQLFSEGSDPS